MEWMEKDKLFHLKFNLEGNAGHILWNKDDKTTVEAAVKLLRNRFGSTGQNERFRAELKARRRKPGEHLQHLYQDISRLIALAYPNKTDEVTNLVARDAFLDALNNRGFVMRIMDKDPTNLDEALNQAIRLESYLDDYSATEPGRSSADRPSRQKEHFSRAVTEEDYHLSSQGAQALDLSEERMIRSSRRV